jgi:quercetin dioxygenase-like cupin family protein
MNRYVVFLVSLLLITCSHLAISQQITEPGMTIVNFSEAEEMNPEDGRKVRRVDASTVGLIRVEWPKGTATAAHNHANELVLAVVEGRLRAISGDREFVMEAGDVAVIPAWVEHSYVALEDTITFEASGPG